MKRIKNLRERFAACGDMMIYLREEDRDFRSTPKNLFDFEKLFGNSNPVHMEVGCGKGGFVCEAAKRQPDVNFLAVERNISVITEACEKAIGQGLTNVRFVKATAEYLPRYIPEKSIERIYLNFSCPFPKPSYAKHRLTHEYFLNIYAPLMKTGAEIHQKTDNMHFFEFSIEQFTKCGFMLKNVSLDLHNSGFEGNIETEYEKRFVSLGQPIYRLEAYIKE
ncbi:MAG: tRNA (guanosine(46)-N7)-methyltransferase TrmB [Clostridia bacterium]|nr:tRNA (guanosine(46)-N7)-methyltransferase TrmB [Clostridia bacterium]